jgi:PAS domain S-box-containing protein
MFNEMMELDFKRVFDASPLPIVIMDATTLRYIDCNSAAIEIYRSASRENLLGRHPVDFAAAVQCDGSPSDEKADYHIRQALENGYTVFEWRHRRPDGEIWDGEVHLRRFDLSDRCLLQFSIIDITERKFTAKMQQLLHDLVLYLNSFTDFKAGCSKVLSTVMEIECIDCGGIYIVEPRDGSLSLISRHGISDEFAACAAHYGADTSQVKMAKTGQVRYSTYNAIRIESDPVRDNEHLRAFAFIPIMAEGQLIALMNLASRSCDNIPEASRTMLETIAFHIGGSLLRLTTAETIRSNERRFKALIKNSSDSITILDENGIQVFVSDAVEKMLGFHPSELMNIPVIAAMIHPDDQRSVQEAFAAIIREGLVCTQYRHRRKDGSWAYLEAWGTNQLDNPDIRGIVVNVRDISERKRVENTLRLRESYLSAIIENQPGLVWLKDRDYRFLAVNRAFALACRRQSPDEVIGKTDFDVWPRDLAEKYRKDDSTVMENGTAVNLIEPIVDKAETRYFETFKVPVRDNDGTIIGTTGYARDITDRKRTEEMFNNMQRLESLGVLAGGIAHDFNNLMGGIYGYLDLARGGGSDAKTAEYLEKAAATINRARGLTHQLLTFAKGGAPVLKAGPLFPFVDETVSFALSGSNVSCRTNADADLWNVFFDKNQIGQVIDNLVINAQQAMPLGGSIDITARNVGIAANEHPRLEAGRYVCLSVRDTGIGIPSDLLPRIFDPFFTTKPKGHGLGLATCYSIVVRHGGYIDVASEPGKGSVFNVYLPAVDHMEAVPEPSGAPQHHGSGTVVIMDDEKVMLETTAAIIESFGYTCVCKENGDDAVKYIVEAINAGRPPKALVFDLTVPGGMGGRETLARVRSIAGGIPAIVASGYADDPVMRSPSEHGFIASICKPFRKEELTAVFNRHVSARG